MNEDQFLVEWNDGHREPQCAPNPAYPEGIDIDVAGEVESYCVRSLPYPAKRCGYYSVRCKLCDFSIAITTAGRPDDPRSVRIPCKLTATSIQ